MKLRLFSPTLSWDCLTTALDAAGLQSRSELPVSINSSHLSTAQLSRFDRVHATCSRTPPRPMDRQHQRKGRAGRRYERAERSGRRFSSENCAARRKKSGRRLLTQRVCASGLPWKAMGEPRYGWNHEASLTYHVEQTVHLS